MATDLFTWSNLVHATCGGLGSAISITAVFPLETARTRLQVDPDMKPRSSLPLVEVIRKKEGWGALYRGWSSLVVALFLTNFTYFYIFHGLRHHTNNTSDVDGNASDNNSGRSNSLLGLLATDLGCASIAGIMTVLFTNPFWVVNTRLKLQGVPGHSSREIKKLKRPMYRGTLHCLSCIWNEEGLPALWAGTTSSLLLVTNPALQFMVYEALKRSDVFHIWATSFFSLFLSSSTVSSSPTSSSTTLSLQHFFNGAMAKLVATVLTYPLQVIQTRRRAGFVRMSITKQITSITRGSGIRGLYRGLESKITQTCLTAALMFFIYEHLATAVFAIAGVSKQ